jgi:hypothetical protein
VALLNLLFSNVLFSGIFGRRRWVLASLLGLCLWLLGGGLAPALAQTTSDSTGTNRRRAGSVPTQPARNLNYDRNSPQSPPPPGERNVGQPTVPGVSRKPAPSLTPDSTGLAADTSRRVRDSLNVVLLRRRSQVETTVKYAAKDSIQFDVTTKIAKLYNKANVDYGKMNLKAALITVNYGTNSVQAAGRRDTVKHRMVDLPLFKDEAGTYSAGKINYNFKTKKGKIAEVVTQQGEGYIHAEVVKKLPDNDFYGLHGRYTTCNLEHPHFYIEAGRMKVIPGQKVITGPFHMVIADVPLPIGLPFGYFPTPHAGRGSGFIIPTFGQGQQRGYSLTNGGYYWAPNDYIGLRVTGDFYAGNSDRIPGGYGIATELTYRKRYKYQGSFRFTYANQPVAPILSTTSAVNSDYLYSNTINTFWISWSHSPTPLPGGGVFSASVQAGSSSYNRVNTLNARQLLSATFNSTISYSKTSRRLPINYAIQLSQSQNVQTGVMDFTLPNFNLGVARQYPYQLFTKQSKGAWYEQFALSYNLVGQNRISSLVPARSLAADVPLLGGSTTAYNIPVSFANAGRLLRNAQNGIQHQFQITIPGFALLNRHIQIQPSVNYGETWYSQRLQYSYLDRVRAIKVDTISPAFERAYSYSANVSASTNFYGTVVFKGDHYIKAIRHKVTPSISYAFSPDLASNSQYEAFVGGASTFGSLQSAYNSRLLDPRQFTRYQGVYQSTASTQLSQVAFTLQNQIEMKVRNNRDTTGTDPYKKVSLADGIDLSIAYNFGSGRKDARGKDVDSLKLSNLNLGYRVQVAKKLNVVISSAFSFYQRDSTGRLINRYLFEGNNKFRLARLLNANLSLGYQFNPAARPKSKANIPRAVAPSNDPILGSPLQQQIYADYIDFDIPWDATVQYTASYTTAGAPIRPTLYGFVPLLSGNSITASGSVKLTPNLRLSTSLNYDLVNNTFVYPTVNFTRDLHCWQISGLWIPVGPYRGYNFTIAAKSSLLQDLKLNRNKTILNR